jgi:clan AA aspartic protease (TIGR02281 family)
MIRRFVAAVLPLLCIEHAIAQGSQTVCFSGSSPDALIPACDDLIEIDPMHAQAYQARGSAWYKVGDYRRAIADYTASLAIDPKYIRNYYNRGIAWEAEGELHNALNDLRTFQNLDPSFPDAQEAIARVTKLLRSQTTSLNPPSPVAWPPEQRAWLDSSCPRSLRPSLWRTCMERESAALVDPGWPNVNTLPPDQRSWLLESCPDSLGPSLWRSCAEREMAALRPKVSPPAPPGTYVNPTPAPSKNVEPKLSQPSPKSSQVTVPLKVSGSGTFSVPVEINGRITLDFTLDSGASDVTLPSDVFTTLKRTGTVKETDIVGQQTFVLADGSKTQSDTFTIRSLKVGDIIIENVAASVAPSQGPLLLGQSFLQRFKSWSIDNATGGLLLETR